MKEGKRIKKLNFTRSFFIGAILIACASLYPKTKEYFEYKKQVTLYNELFENDLDNRVTPSITASHSSTLPTPLETPTILPHLATLLEHNKDIIGWITIPNTPINYPLTQHTDNQYYLEHNSINEPSVYGSIYVDYRNDKCFTDKNTLIYGHNMKNGTMFHELINYKEENYFKEHPYVYISDLYETLIYEIFAVYVVDANIETVEVEYESDEAFGQYIKACETRSMWHKEINLESEDQIITLVTCSYETNNARTLVQAKLIK